MSILKRCQIVVPPEFLALIRRFVPASGRHIIYEPEITELAKIIGNSLASHPEYGLALLPGTSINGLTLTPIYRLDFYQRHGEGNLRILKKMFLSVDTTDVLRREFALQDLAELPGRLRDEEISEQLRRESIVTEESKALSLINRERARFQELKAATGSSAEAA